MDKIKDLETKIRHYRWLQNIAKEYGEMLERIEHEEKYFTIYGICYSARGDETHFNIYPSYGIPYNLFHDWLKSKVYEVNAELEKCKEELEGLS